MNKITLIVISLLLGIGLSAQSIKIIGTVQSQPDQENLPGVNVLLRNAGDKSLVAAGITNGKGKFELRAAKNRPYTLTLSFIGFATKEITFTPTRDTVIDVNMTTDSKQLDEVVITEAVIPIQIKGDTTEFAADAFTVNPDASVEDLIKKLPGVTVEGGQIKSQGQNIDRVLVDKEEFFGNDALSVVRNLPADIADKIQIYDEQSEQARFSGFDDGQERKVLNIVTKKDKRIGRFGKLEAAGGTEDRYATGGNINFFNNQKRLTITAQANNTNQLDVGQEQQQIGGPFGRFRSFFQGNQPNEGINTLASGSINFRNAKANKYKYNFGYTFNNNINLLETERVRETFLAQAGQAGFNQFSNDFREATTTVQTHRLNGRFEFEFDSLHSIVITPNLAYNRNKLLSEENSITTLGQDVLFNRGSTSLDNTRDSYSGNVDFLFRKKFQKPSRTFSANLNLSLSSSLANNFLLADNFFPLSAKDTSVFRDQRQEIDNSTRSIRTDFSYTEPLNKTNFLEFTYKPSYRITDNNQFTESINVLGETVYLLDTALTNEFNNLVHSQRAGVNYRYKKGNFEYTVGMDGDLTWLNSEQFFPNSNVVEKPFQNLFPSMYARYSPTKTSNLRLSLRTSNNLPSVAQLQDVVDNSNPLVLITGNTGLEQEYTYNAQLSYGFFSMSGKGGFFRLAYTRTHDVIGNTTRILFTDSITPEGLVLNSGTQIIRPENLDARENILFFGAYNVPITKLKINLNMNGSVNHLSNPAQVNGEANRINNTSFSGGMGVASNVGEYLDFNLRSNYTYFLIENRLQPQLSNNYSVNTNIFSINWLPKNTYVLNIDLSNSQFYGLDENIQQNFNRLNAGVGYKFLKGKKAEIRLTVYDLLNQNTAINREVTALFVEDTRSLVLNRFFMLRFLYQFRDFKGQRPPLDEQQSPWGGGRGGRRG